MAKNIDETSSDEAKKLEAIEELQLKLQIPTPVFRGVCAAEGWSSGKYVSPDEFKAAVARYLRKKIGR